MQQQYYMSITGSYLYMGDMQEGDRKATQAEVDAYMIQINKSVQKQEIAQQLALLTVTTSSGNVFDANLEARQNMSDAIIASANMKDLIDKGLLPSDTVWDRRTWRLADNSEPIITIDELKEAHALAILEYARIKGIGA